VVSFAIGALEGMRVWFALLGFKPGRINFGVSFTTLTEFPTMFRFVRPVALNVFGSLNSTRKGGVTPLPANFTLGDSRIHVCFSDRSDMIAHVEAPINKEFSILPALHVPNIYPNDGHVQFW